MTSHQESSLVSSFYDTTSDEEYDEDENDEEIFQETHDIKKEENYHSNLWHSWRALHTFCDRAPSKNIRGKGKGIYFFALGGVLNPRATWIQEWNKIFLLVCATSLFVDPLFVYTLSISEKYLSLFIDGWFAITVTVLRCMIDGFHLLNIWLHLKMANHPLVVNEELVNDDGMHDKDDISFVCSRYLKARQGFLFDLFVILPVPQVMIWFIIPYLLSKGLTTNEVINVFLFMFLFQYLPKIYHAICLLRRIQKICGDCFGTMGWAFAIKMMAYFVASLVFLHATTSRKQTMQIRMRSIEWWMHKRKIPNSLKQRVRNYEWQRWAATRGVDEFEMIRNLPEGLRRDIKYHLCLDLVKQVPLFHHMDDLVLENICDRVQSLIFTKGETITREGDPVQRMLFIVRGHLQSSQELRDGVKSCCMLGPGNFSGDELLSWCLRRPFIERLPASSSTLVTLETTEAFGLEAQDVKYVTQHFRYIFANDKVRRSARYYSPGWRTWGAIAIQLAWRRYKRRMTLASLSFIRPRRPLSRSSSLSEDRLRVYSTLLTSSKSIQDDLD